MSSSQLHGLLLVDGYNIIGSWANLKRSRDRDGLETARRDLIEALTNYSVLEGFKTEIVFDAHYQKTPGYREPQTPNLSVYYTNFAQTADTYIEKVCASLYRQLNRPISRFIVATSDRAQQLTVMGYGAEWLSAQELAKAVEHTARAAQRKTRPQKNKRGRFLFDSLDAKSQERLAELRLGNRKMP